MENFKEFQGKDLDAAIKEACAYFNTEREKLEIEILQDAKTGIFGIVGARKAKVRARRAQLREAVESILGRKSDSPPSSAALASFEAEEADALSKSEPPRRSKPRLQREPDVQPPVLNEPVENTAVSASEVLQEKESHSQNREAESTQAVLSDYLEEAAEGLPLTPVEELDVESLKKLTEEVVRHLVRPIVGDDVRLEVHVGNGRVQARVDCDEDSGLLIGREGQTLAALRYLASRLVSRGMNAAVRIQLDAGEYRQRQDEKLREMALALADKVLQSGRSYSTRPLSSYHRRIVHVCLQDVEEIQTRSTGDGPLKRVVITRRKPERA